jgi:predicted enzyme related to lactoylglutathione lyase
MNSKAIVPLLTTNKLTETRDFYRGYLGFEVLMESECYLGLRLGEGGLELGFMPESEEHPLSSGAGLLYCFPVENVDAEYEALQKKGAPLAGPPEDMPWGDRRVYMADPNGITVYLGQQTAATMDCAAEVG